MNKNDKIILLSVGGVGIAAFVSGFNICNLIKNREKYHIVAGLNQHEQKALAEQKAQYEERFLAFKDSVLQIGVTPKKSAAQTAERFGVQAGSTGYKYTPGAQF